jgi:hypothetical protein
MSDFQVDREIARKTRRSFLVGGVATLAGAGAWEWVRSRHTEGDIPWPLRAGLQADEEFTRDYFRETRLARTFSVSDIETPRENGDIGLESPVDPGWKLSFGESSLTLDDVKTLPKTEMITELKCIEGWSRVTQWGGARLGDFIAKYYQDDIDPESYVALETPGGEYYVGIEMASAMHPQTLLCYEMNGRPLEPQYGAPLRLAIPLKYGIKNLKRIGKISIEASRPKDYWAENGYDWYAGF